MTWRVSLHWQLEAAIAEWAKRFWELQGNTYINGGFLADVVGHWDHERKCVK